ncbi:MAG TPA: hypothetical protein VI685_17685 [Candidatus Angelobacter sp.]
MKIIILAPAGDNHTAPIKWALQQAGYKVACWAGLSWIESRQASLLFDQQTKLTLGPYEVEAGDVVWIRRPELPEPNPEVLEADRKFADHEYRNFYQSIAYLLEALQIRSINKYSAARFINNKGVQLHLANACGLKVPKTLLSNSPQATKNFFSSSSSRMICKAFTPHSWERRSRGDLAITETFEITRKELPEDEIFTFAPGIYQDMVVKQFDVRTVLMGDKVYSHALHNPRKALDWRGDASRGRVDVGIIATPREIEEKLVEFARKAGICFGSVDFAVDMDGQWWFLEINEEGQFLWLDQMNPAARMQQRFCAFLTGPEGSTESLEDRAGLFSSFLDYINFPDKEDATIAAPVPVGTFLSVEP